MNAFGIQIRKLREQKKMTLRYLAERSNLSYSFIASLEKGRYNPSRESVYSLATPLEADVNELLILAGFLPEQTEAIKKHYSTSANKSEEPFELETILKMHVTFQGNKLHESDKVALTAFLKTILGLKERS
ncbi:helix-turn-helix domain-containing protein [Sporosarcina sp. FSL K6-1508]|uniref:helix-turn-helix domain-containing protein n=1 Tax=Sporosarcina sp. FSL K6-1508 TaxID=2921553 RepID=UPI0030F6410F